MIALLFNVPIYILWHVVSFGISYHAQYPTLLFISEQLIPEKTHCFQVKAIAPVQLLESISGFIDKYNILRNAIPW